MNRIIKPDWREFIAENTGMLFIASILMGTTLFIGDFLGSYFGLGSAILFVIVILILTAKYVTLNAISWTINDETICQTKGVFVKKMAYVELYRVTDYGATQTFLQRICGVKTITIISTDKSDPLMPIFGVLANLNLISEIRNKVELIKKEKRIYEIANH